MADPLEDLKTLCKNIMTDFRNERVDITNALRNLERILQQFIANEYPPELSTYVREYILLTSAQALISKRQFLLFTSNLVLIDKVTDCLCLFAQIAAANIENDSRLGQQLIYEVMNAEAQFFVKFGHDLKHQRGLPLTPEAVAANATWRSSLGDGDHVDFFIDGRWKHGVVRSLRENEIRIIPEADTSLHRQTQQALDDDEFSDEVYEYNEETFAILAPCDSQVPIFRPKMERWRTELAPTGRCDVLDSVNKWYTCTITELDDFNNKMKVHYDNWNSKYDEWVARDDLRVQPFRTRARGGRESGGVYGVISDVEPVINDEDDPDDAFALFRGRAYPASFHLVAVFNAFGEAGGFDAVQRRLENDTPNMPVASMRYILSSISKATKIYARGFGEGFLPRICELAIATLLRLSPEEMRELKKDFLERIVVCIDEMLRRHLTRDEVAERTEKFQLQMALNRLNSNTIERRVNGLQYVANACLYTRSRSVYGFRWVDKAFLLKWIDDNALIPILFGQDSHPHLMKQSVEILKFLLNEKQLHIDHLATIWTTLERAAAKADDVENEVETVCKVIDMISYYLEPEHYDFIFDRFDNMDLRTLTQPFLQLMKDLSKNVYKPAIGKKPAQKSLHILWRFIQLDEVPKELVTNAQKLLKDILNTPQTRELRFQYMQACLENIREHRAVFQTLKVLTKILEMFPKESYSTDGARWKLIENLIEKGLLDCVFLDIQHAKAHAAEQLERVPNLENLTGKARNEAINTMILFNYTGYLDEVKERLNFLDFVMTNSRAIVSQEQAETLWGSVVHSSLTPHEREHALRWFKSVVIKERLMPGVAEHLFVNMILQDLDPRTLAKDGYECFEKYFLHVNSQRGTLLLLGDKGNFRVVVWEILGLEELWDIVMNTEKVRKRSLAFLNKVYTRLSSELKDDVALIRRGCVERCMTIIAENARRYKEAEDGRGQSQAASRITRVLDLLNRLLDASAQRGSGGPTARPHGALTHGKRLHFNVSDRVNNPSYYTKANVVKVYICENDTLWDLRVAISEKIEAYPEALRILANGKDYKEDQNSLTIARLAFRDGQNITAMKHDRRQERVPLVQNRPAKLVPAAKKALTSIFQKYASNPDKTMSQTDMRKYIIDCNAGENSANQHRIQQIFAQYSKDRDRFNKLDMEGFLCFYCQACVDRPDHVWNDLTCFKYRFDLRHEDEAHREEMEAFSADAASLPRNILSSTQEYFDLLFDECLTLASNDVVSAVWTLLLRLPTNPSFNNKISSLSSVNSPEDWHGILPPDDISKLTYALLACEALVTEPEDAENDESLEDRARWRHSFLSKGGFQHLLAILRAIEYEPSTDTTSAINSNKQSAIASILKMVNAFFASAVACMPDMEDLVKQIQSLSLGEDEVGNDGGGDGDADEDEKKAPLPQPVNKSKPAGPGGKATQTGRSNSMDANAGEGAEYGPHNAWGTLDDFDVAEGGEADDDFAKELQLKYELDLERASRIPPDFDAAEEPQVAEPEPPAESPDEPQLPATDEQEEPGSVEEAGAVGATEEKTEKDKDEKGDPPEDEQGDVEMSDMKTYDEEDTHPKRLSRRESTARFTDLIREQTEEYSTELIEAINYSELSSRILQILKIASSDTTAETQHRQLVVRYAVRLWVSLILFRPDLLPNMFREIQNDPSVVLISVQSPDGEIGREFSKGVKKLCLQVENSPNFTEEIRASLDKTATKFFLDILLGNLPDARHAGGAVDPQEHFWLLISLLQEYVGEKYNGSVSEFGELFDYLITELTAYRSQEETGKESIDKILVGMLTLLSVLLSHHQPFRVSAGAPDQHDLVHLVFDDFLFSTGKTGRDLEENLPKCKTRASRGVAFRVLVQMCLETGDNFHELTQRVQGLHGKIERPSAALYDYSPQRYVRSPTGYVGLKNLGSTCYMNSLLQQWYMMPHYRNALVLAVQQKEWTAESSADSFLFQLARMFGYLTLSERQWFETLPFCQSYKDNGQPVDPRIQQDAQEFFTNAVDTIEKELKETEYEHLMRDIFGGKVVNQMLCQGGCNTVREREQTFVMISLPVKGRSNMKESLDAYVQSEMLSGVNCDACGQKSDTNKREVLHVLPNTIYFHLKRFELNFETFRHEKINTRFEFDEKINLEPYTREGLERLEKEEKAKEDNSIVVPELYSNRPQTYYEYVLAGVVVHTGNAEAGHYYSYIRDRHTSAWNEFNDSLLKPFDSKQLDSHTYGGQKKVTRSNQYGTYEWEDHQERIKNAYILVYDRAEYCQPEADIPLTPPEENAPAADANESKTELDGKDQEDEPDAVPPPEEPQLEEPEPEDAEHVEEATVEEVKENYDLIELLAADTAGLLSPAVSDEIRDDNIAFTRDQQVFNMQYFKFIYDLIRVAPEYQNAEYAEDDSTEVSVVRLATDLFFSCLARVADKHKLLGGYIRYLKFLYSENIPACLWLTRMLVEDKALVGEFILKTRDVTVIAGFQDLTTYVLKVLSPHESEKLEELTTETRTDHNGQEFTVRLSAAWSGRFMDMMFELMLLAPKHCFRFADYFKVFLKFAQIGTPQTRFLIGRHTITRFGDFYLGDASPFADPAKPPPQMGSRMYPPKFDVLVQTLAYLIRSCHTRGTQALKAEREAAESTDGLPDPYPPTAIFEDGQDLLPLTDNDARICESISFYSKMIGEAQTRPNTVGEALNDIVCHWSYEHEPYSNQAIGIIRSGVEKLTSDQVKVYFRIMDRFCSIDDRLQGWRISRLISAEQGGILYYIRIKSQNQTVTFISMKMMIEMMQTNDILRAAFLEQREHWKWWDTWLDSYCKRKTYVNYNQTAQPDSMQDKQAFLAVYKSLVVDNGHEFHEARYTASTGSSYGNDRYLHGASNAGGYRGNNSYTSGTGTGHGGYSHGGAGPTVQANYFDNSTTNDDLYENDQMDYGREDEGYRGEGDEDRDEDMPDAGPGNV